MYAELENGDVVELVGLMTTTLPNGSTQELLYYLYNGVKVPLPYAHSPYKRIVRSAEQWRYQDNRYNVPAHVEIWKIGSIMQRPDMRNPSVSGDLYDVMRILQYGEKDP